MDNKTHELLCTIADIDGKILDLIDLIRNIWPNFNSIPHADKVVGSLYDAYKANGKLADAIDKGWIK
jgi:hypothetical protein